MRLKSRQWNSPLAHKPLVVSHGSWLSYFGSGWYSSCKDILFVSLKILLHWHFGLLAIFFRIHLITILYLIWKRKNTFLHPLLVMVCYLASVFHSWYPGGITLLMVQGYSLLSLSIMIASACLSWSDFSFVPAWCVLWCFLYPLLDSGFSLYVAKRALSTLSCLRYISSVLFHFGVLPPYGYLLAPVTFSIAKLRQADYRKYRMVLFASQKDWQPSALYI